MSDAVPTPVAITARREAEYEPTRTQRLIWASQRRHDELPVANMGERMRIVSVISAKGRLRGRDVALATLVEDDLQGLLAAFAPG